MAHANTLKVDKPNGGGMGHHNLHIAALIGHRQTTSALLYTS